MAESFTQLLADNKDWIVGGIQFTVKWVGNLLAAINRLMPVFALIGVGFLAMKIAALGFGTVMGIILSPIVLITAGVVALLLIVDDLIVAFSGGQSVIADFFQDTFGIDIVDALTTAFQFLKTNAIDPLIESFKFWWSLWQKLVGGIMSGGAAITSLLGFGGDDDQAVRPSRSTIPMGVNAGNNSNTATSNTVEQKVDIQISTNDPEAAGRAVSNGLQKQLDNANTQLSTGGR